MIILVKLICLFLGLTVIAKTYIDYKRKYESLTVFLFWTLTWIVIIYASLQPAQIYQFVQSLSRENIGLGTFGGIAFIFIFYLTYRVYIKANRLEQKLHDVVIEIGLKEIDK